MAKGLTLSICHLYSDLMDTYGDKGNIIAIKNRCNRRGIKTFIDSVSVGDNLNYNKYDFYFFGGGQDKIQAIVGNDLKKKKGALVKSIDTGAVLLSICGGYQLLQKYFRTLHGETIKGIGLFDAYTIGSTQRMIQNLLVELNYDIQKEIRTIYEPATRYQQPVTELIGFENHSGKTYLGKKTKSLGQTIIGSGNNSEDKTEGAIYKSAFGCYLHGSLLPKNPHFADFLIYKSLERRYGKIKLKPLDDFLEWQAHKSAIKRTRHPA